MRTAMTVMAWTFVLTLVGCGGDGSESSGDPEGMEDVVDPVSPGGDPTSVRSDFDDGTADGWTITDADTAMVSSDGSCGLVQVDPGDGFLCANAVEENDTSYYVAPEKFTGDLNVFTELSFRLVASGGSYYDSGRGFDGDVSISNGVSKATYTFSEDQRPAEVWQDYRISLTDAEAWTVDDGAPLPTVLQSVTELRIRAEYGVGVDNSGLDDVSLD